MSRKIWTEERINILKDNYYKLNYDELSIFLGATKSAIQTVCQKQGLRRYININRNYRNTGFKICTKCLKKLPATVEYFSYNFDKREGKNRLRSVCKECSCLLASKRESNLESYIKCLLRSKKSDKRKFEEVIDLTLDFLINLYEKQHGKCAITGIEMTHERGTGFNLRNMSIDRIDSKIGYVKDNVQLVCLWANVSKNSLTSEEFKKYITLTYNNFVCQE